MVCYYKLMSYNFAPLKEKLAAAEQWLKNELSNIRTGRATPVLLDAVQVESYGSKMPINQVASVSIEDPRTLRVSPWDNAQIKPIEKAITVANLGLSVVTDDKGLRVVFPELTTERRTQFAKAAKGKLEEARVAVRTAREEVWTDIQKKEKAGEMSEDEKFRAKEEMQKMVDELNARLDEQYQRKEKEILS